MERYYLEIQDRQTKHINRMEFASPKERWGYLLTHKILGKLDCIIREVNEY